MTTRIPTAPTAGTRKGSGMQPAPVLLAIVLASVLPSEPRAEWIFDAEAGSGYEDNVSRADLSRDKESDIAILAAGSAGWPFHPTEGSTLTLTGGFRSAFSTTFSGLTNHAPGLSVSFRQKLGLGAFAPFIQAGGRYDLQIYEDDLREGAYAEIDALFGKRVSERWGFKTEAGVSRRDADSEVFDQHAVFAGIHADIALIGEIELYAGYRLRIGDVTSSAIPDSYLAKASKEIAPDEVFGDRVRAYLLEGTSHGLQVGVSWPVSDRASIDAAYEYVVTSIDPERDVKDEPDYQHSRLHVSYLHRF